MVHSKKEAVVEGEHEIAVMAEGEVAHCPLLEEGAVVQSLSMMEEVLDEKKREAMEVRARRERREFLAGAEEELDLKTKIPDCDYLGMVVEEELALGLVSEAVRWPAVPGKAVVLQISKHAQAHGCQQAPWPVLVEVEVQDSRLIEP